MSYISPEGQSKSFLRLLSHYCPLNHCREGDKIVLEGEADQLPDQEPGSIIFSLVETEHSTFRRSGPDLSAEVHISLSEALCGFSRILIKHLDGRGLHVKHPQSDGEPLKPGTVIKVSGEGMPYKKSELRGDLYLIINVDFPDANWLRQNDRMKKLEDLLPKPTDPIQADTVDDVDYTKNVDINSFGAGNEGDQWEDEDEDDGAQAQCAQQ